MHKVIACAQKIMKTINGRPFMVVGNTSFSTVTEIDTDGKFLLRIVTGDVQEVKKCGTNNTLLATRKRLVEGIDKNHTTFLKHHGFACIINHEFSRAAQSRSAFVQSEALGELTSIVDSDEAHLAVRVHDRVQYFTNKDRTSGVSTHNYRDRNGHYVSSSRGRR